MVTLEVVFITHTRTPVHTHKGSLPLSLCTHRQSQTQIHTKKINSKTNHKFYYQKDDTAKNFSYKKTFASIKA